MKTKKEELFSEYIEKWCKKTWLGWWHIEVRYMSAFEYTKVEGFDPLSSLAMCTTHWQYMTALIRVNSDLLEEQNEEDIEDRAVHELMHILVNEMREEGICHEERVVTVLARSFLLTESTSKI